MELIKVEKLKKSFVNEGVETSVLHGIDFVIEKGEFVAIMGPSGSGKSTLMHILGFLDKLTEGNFYFDGRDVSKLDDDELAKMRSDKVGFIFQAFNLLPRTTVFENVILPLAYTDLPESAQIKEAKQVIESVGLSHRINYTPGQLSGGEKQRVAIARALVNEPSIIFADEPTGNLDSKSGLQIMKLLQNLNKQGHTIILVTHERYTAEHAKRIIKLKDGIIVSDEEVKNRLNADGAEELVK